MDRRQLIDELVKIIPELTADQLYWIKRVINVIAANHKFIPNRTDLFDKVTLQTFGDALRIHHAFSDEPFTKDKFEYLLVKVLKLRERDASRAPRGNPGYDAIVDGTKLSLKTQADNNIKADQIWISKFMELGKGKWGDNEKDLCGLCGQFLEHMKKYERILTLRALQKNPNWKYELVEIPKSLLAQAKNGKYRMMHDSRQFPKPGYCRVSEKDDLLFELYFDGGTERKLQIKGLRKDRCLVHATWEFVIPPE
jgi:type II restriction enzyme